MCVGYMVVREDTSEQVCVNTLLSAGPGYLAGDLKTSQILMGFSAALGYGPRATAIISRPQSSCFPFCKLFASFATPGKLHPMLLISMHVQFQMRKTH